MRISGVTQAALAIALWGAVARAQSLDIYSEFRRVDPFGNVVAADRALAPREILSPAVARNAFASFQIVVSAPPKESYFLYVVPNPLNACLVALYKEHFVQTSQGWIPDTLTEIHRLPDFGAMPDPDDNIEGQTTRLYLLDLWIPPNADVARFRLEVQMKVADWTVRPMEVRVLAARIPDLDGTSDGGPLPILPPIDAGADASALDAVRSFTLGLPLAVDAHPLTLRGVIRRNAMQDMRLARGREAVATRAIDLLWTNLQFRPRIFGAEWYLRLRDFLLAY